MANAVVEVVRVVRALSFMLLVTLAALVVLALDLVILPYVLLKDPTRYTYHRLNAVLAIISMTPFFSVEVIGQDNLPADGAVVIAANHQSALDAFILALLGQHNFKCVFKRSLLFYPGLGQCFALARHISVIRGDKKSAAECMESVNSWLKRGVSVLFFPEGTRKIGDGVLGPFKSGAFRAALEADVPVCPVTIRGARELMKPTGVPSMGWGKVTLVVHPPIESKGKEYKKLSEETRDVILSGLKED